MHELYFCHFLYFCGTLNNNELKRISRRDYNNHRLNGWELDREVTLIFHFSLFTFHLRSTFHFSLRRRRFQPQIERRISQNSKFINSKFKGGYAAGDFNNELKRISQRDLGYFNFSLFTFHLRSTFTFHFAVGDRHRLH